MLSVIWTILKIIGILLLVLVCLLLVLLCLALFVPVRYRAQGFYRATYEVSGKISWLLSFLTVRFSYGKDQPFLLIIRVLGIPIRRFPAKEKKAEKDVSATRRKKKSKSEKTQPQMQAASLDSDPETEQNLPDEPVEAAYADEKIGSAEAGFSDKTECSANAEEPVEQEIPKKLSLLQKIKNVFAKIVYFVRNIQYTFRQIYGRIVTIKDNITYYLALLQEDSTKIAFTKCQKQLYRVFRNLKPTHYQVNLHIGMSDPASMGNVMGVWGMLYPWHEGRIMIEPDFEQPVFEGDFYMKGRLTAWLYLWAVCYILFDKDIKQFRKCLMREDV